MTQRGTTANSIYDMEQKEALQHLQPSGLGCPGSFNTEMRRKKLMKEICREEKGVNLAGMSARGQADPQHPSPAERCLSLQTHIDLHWEPAPTSRTLLFRFGLATRSEFSWATSLWPKSALQRRFAHLHKSKKSPLAWPVLTLLKLWGSF